VREFDVHYNPVLSLKELDIIRTMWDESNEGTERAQDNISMLFDKIKEEYQEMVEGEDETPQIYENTLCTTGDSRYSEAITVLLTVLHWMRQRSELTYAQIIGLLSQRFREQAWRYDIIPEVTSEVTLAKSNPRDLTYWIVRRSRDGRMMSVKIKFENDRAYMSEVVDLNTSVHLQGEKLVLPVSYTPYAEKQRVTGISETVRGIDFGDGTYLDFFNPRGVEMIDYEDKGEYIPFDEIDFRADQVIIGSFTGMQSL